MNPDTMNVGCELAALRFYLTQAERMRHDWAEVFAAVRMHPAAVEASAVEAMRGALDVPCPDCQAGPGEPCRPDCSSHWDEP